MRKLFYGGEIRSWPDGVYKTTSNPTPDWMLLIANRKVHFFYPLTLEAEPARDFIFRDEYTKVGDVYDE